MIKQLKAKSCQIKRLTEEESDRVPAVEMHHPGPPVPGHLAVVLAKRWQPGVKLGVSFLENQTQGFINKVLAYANKWSEASGGGSVQFAWSQSQGEVRVTTQGDGYWSYLGKDILGIAAGQPTLCLEGFTEGMAESEWDRVVPHEFGHTLGFPHEHMRKELVALIDPAKAIAYFRQNQGWSRDETIQQVLTPINDASIMGTPQADATSVMCYMLPGSIMKNGAPITGGTGINARDYDFVKKVYPPLGAPVTPPPPPPGPTGGSVVLPPIKVTLDAAGKVLGVQLA